MHNPGNPNLSFLRAFRPSRLVLGTVQFGLKYGIANRAGQPAFGAVCEILACAAGAGVNCLDTAAIYGSSEDVLGRALRETGLAGRMAVVSKVPAVPDDLAGAQVGEFIRAAVLESLRRLSLDSLPLCLFHRESDSRYFDELLKLRAAGLIRHAGVSADNSPAPAVGIARALPVDALQLPMNVLDCRHENSGVLRIAQSRGLAVFVRSVYLQGLLLMPEEDIMPELAPVIPARRRLAAIAREAGMGMDELALRYILSLDGVTSVIAGVETVPQMRRNAELFQRGALPEDLIAAIRRATPELPGRLLSPKYWPNRMPPSTKPGG